MIRPTLLLKRVLLLFVWALVGLVLGVFVSALVGEIYAHLARWFPEVFPIYNAVLDGERYEKFSAVLDLISLVLTLFAVVYLSLRFDNKRSEWVISRTDGLFLIRDEYLPYTERYFAEDALCSLLIGLALTVPFAFIPARFLETNTVFTVILRLLYSASKALGLPLFITAVTLTILFCHLAASPLAMRVYRARWLTDFTEIN